MFSVSALLAICSIAHRKGSDAMYRIYQKQLSTGRWTSLELACHDRNFLIDVLHRYSIEFNVSKLLLRIHQDDSNRLGVLDDRDWDW